MAPQIGDILNQAVCNVVSVLIGAVMIVGAIALVTLIMFLIIEGCKKFTAFIASHQKPLTPEQKQARIRRQERNQKIVGGLCVAFWVCVALVIFWLFGSPVCDAVFHKAVH